MGTIKEYQNGNMMIFLLLVCATFGAYSIYDEMKNHPTVQDINYRRSVVIIDKLDADQACGACENSYCCVRSVHAKVQVGDRIPMWHPVRPTVSASLEPPQMPKNQLLSMVCCMSVYCMAIVLYINNPKPRTISSKDTQTDMSVSVRICDSRVDTRAPVRMCDLDLDKE